MACYGLKLAGRCRNKHLQCAHCKDDLLTSMVELFNFHTYLLMTIFSSWSSWWTSTRVFDKKFIGKHQCQSYREISISQQSSRPNIPLTNWLQIFSWVSSYWKDNLEVINIMCSASAHPKYNSQPPSSPHVLPRILYPEALLSDLQQLTPLFVLGVSRLI